MTINEGNNPYLASARFIVDLARLQSTKFFTRGLNKKKPHIR